MGAGDITSPAEHVVGYGQPSLRIGRRRALRWVLAAMLLTALVQAAARWGPPWYGHVRHMYWQSACMNHEVAPGTVVYEEVPGVAGALLAARPAVFRRIPPGRVPMPGEFPVPPVAIYHAEAIHKLLPDQSAQWDGVAFMHRRRSSSGRERLVVVPVVIVSSYAEGFRTLIYGANVVVPSTWWRLSPAATAALPTRCPPPLAAQWDYEVFPKRFVPSFRMYAGQPDPVNASRFVIRYEVRTNYPEAAEEWERGELQGTLRDDDTVELKVTGPLSPQFPKKIPSVN